MAGEHADEAPPALRRLMEAVVAVMELDEGHVRLDFTFSDGHLVRWYVHGGPYRVDQLRRFDHRAQYLEPR